MADRIVRVDVDTQAGFCTRGGGLHVEGAEHVLPLAARLNADAVAKGIPLLGSVDTHEAHSKEFAVNGGIWPVHCVKGTADWLKLPETLPPKFWIVAAVPYPKLERRDDVALYFEKDLYSLFDNPNADPIVRGFGAERAWFQLYGVATDYCVKAAALGIRERCPDSRIDVVEDAVRGVAPDTTEAAWKELAAARIGRVRAADLL